MGNIPGRLIGALAHTGFRRLTSDLVRTYVRPYHRSLGSTNLDASSVSRIVLMNNSAHVPTMRTVIRGFFNGTPSGNIGPSRIMTMNTTVRKKMLANRMGSILLLSIAPLSLNVRAVNNMVAGLVRTGAAVPAGGSRAFAATISGRPSMRVRMLRNRHSLTGSGGSVNHFRLSKVPTTRHNIPRVRIAFSVSTGNVLGMSTGSGKANGMRDVHVRTSDNLDSSRMGHVGRRTRTGTRTSGGRGRHVSGLGRTSDVVFRARGRLGSLNSGLPTSGGTPVRATLGGLGRTRGTRSVTNVSTTVTRLGDMFRTTDRRVCGTRGTRNNTRPNPSFNRRANNGTNGGGRSNNMASISFRRIGWACVFAWRGGTVTNCFQRSLFYIRVQGPVERVSLSLGHVHILPYEGLPP